MRKGTRLFTRSRQKTWTYAKLFGAGDPKLGNVALDDWADAIEQGLTEEPLPKRGRARELGKVTQANLGNAIPAFPLLEKALESTATAGFLTTLDGRRIPVSSAHTAIARLLQGGEAVIMKKAMALARPFLTLYQAEYVLWVHDEFQVECLPEHVDAVGRELVQAMESAGEYYDLRVKIDGEYKVGQTWSDTH